MARPRLEIGAWAFVAWAVAAVLLTPTTRFVAESHGFVVARMVIVDVVLVGYALLAGGFVGLQLGRGRPSRGFAALAALPLAFEAMDGIVGRFTLRVSDYPLSLAILHWLGNTAFLGLMVILVLLLLARPAETPSRAAV